MTTPDPYMAPVYWAPHGTPPPRDMDEDGVPVSLTEDGATRWDLIGTVPQPPLPGPIKNLEDL